MHAPFSFRKTKLVPSLVVTTNFGPKFGCHNQLWSPVWLSQPTLVVTTNSWSPVWLSQPNLVVTTNSGNQLWFLATSCGSQLSCPSSYYTRRRAQQSSFASRRTESSMRMHRTCIGCSGCQQEGASMPIPW